MVRSVTDGAARQASAAYAGVVPEGPVQSNVVGVAGSTQAWLQTSGSNPSFFAGGRRTRRSRGAPNSGPAVGFPPRSARRRPLSFGVRHRRNTIARPWRPLSPTRDAPKRSRAQASGSLPSNSEPGAPVTPGFSDAQSAGRCSLRPLKSVDCRVDTLFNPGRHYAVDA